MRRARVGPGDGGEFWMTAACVHPVLLHSLTCGALGFSDVGLAAIIAAERIDDSGFFI